MDSFKVSYRKCLRHSKPITMVCLNKACKDIACCADCLKSSHPH